MRAAARRCRCARSPASPSLFLGTGEKTEALEAFDPDRMARRILGMGDVVALVEEVHRNVDVERGRAAGARRLPRARDLTSTISRASCSSCRRWAAWARCWTSCPVAAAAARKLPAGQADQELRRQIALIDSMTPRERRRPEIIDGSRRRRIAAGAGMQVQDVNRLLKQHQEHAEDDEAAGRSGKLQRHDGRPWPGKHGAVVR